MSRRKLILAIDRREQRPYRYGRSEVKTLASGDYSIVGLEDCVAVERKSKSDAYSSIGSGRRRFERELQRLAELDFSAVVIESSLPAFLVPPVFTQLRPQSAIATVIAWSVKYGVPFYFASDRRHGQALTRNLLKYYFRYHGEAQLVG